MTAVTRTRKRARMYAWRHLRVRGKVENPKRSRRHPQTRMQSLGLRVRSPWMTPTEAMGSSCSYSAGMTELRWRKVEACRSVHRSRYEHKLRRDVNLDHSQERVSWVTVWRAALPDVGSVPMFDACLHHVSYCRLNRAKRRRRLPAKRAGKITGICGTSDSCDHRFGELESTRPQRDRRLTSHPTMPPSGRSLR